MARSVTFGGQTLFHPGALSKVNANALAPVGLTTSGVVAVLGEADGGAPGTIVTIDDPALAGPIFKSGAVADAVRIAFDPSNDPRIPAGAFRVLAYKTNASTQAGTQLPGATNLLTDTTVAGASTTVFDGAAASVTLNQHVGRWLKFGTNRRRIVSNTASPAPTYTVSPGFPAAPGVAAGFSILNTEMNLTSQDYGVHTNSISVEFEPGSATSSNVVTLTEGVTVNQSPDLGGYPFLVMEYIGGPIPTNGSGTILSATTSTVSLTVAAPPLLNAFAGMVLQFSDGTQRLITGNTAANPTVITLDPAHVITTTQATAFAGQAAAVRNVTQANVSITGTNGVAKTLTSAVLPTADDLNITFAANQTLNQFVNQINATTNYRASVPAGLNGDVTLMSSFDFGTRATNVDVRFDQGILPDTKGNFRRDLQLVIDWINGFSTLATATRSTAGTTEGAEVPLNTGGVVATVQDIPLYFIGGTRGISSNSSFQAGFDAFLQVRTNHIVPLISQDLVNEGNSSTATFASVAAQLSAHVHTTSGIGRSERGGYIGMKGTKTQLLNQIAAINNTDVQLTGQKITVLDASGNLVTQPEWSSAVAAAGMRAGAPEVGEPLTFKNLKTNALAQDSSWSPRSVTDVNALLQGGLLFAEQVIGGGFRWVKDITTYLVDDNIAYLEGSTRDAVRYVAYDLRTELENQFTGLKAKPATVASMRDTVAAKMSLYLAQNIIVQSLDPETLSVTIPGYRRLRVTISGNTATVRVEIFPVVGISFTLLDITLQLPSLAA